MLPGERSGRAAPAPLAALRLRMAAAMESGMWRTEPPAREASLSGVRVLRFLPPAAKRGCVLHLHGGGFRLGCPEMIGAYATALAQRCQVEVVCPAYRLAPEHPFPSGLIDARAVMLALLREAGDAPLILSGDSAGGGLAASLALLSSADTARPAGVVLLSAWLDLTVSSATYDDNAASDPLFSFASAEEAAELYLQGASARQPLASPLLGSLQGYPPTFISVGEGEVLAGDAHRFHRALTGAKVRTQLSALADMQHVAVTRDLALPGAADTFDAVAAFVDNCIG